MACPHVSGIAALIVSKFGKQGFTNKELRKRLLGGLLQHNIDEENPKYKGKLGLGYIDAYSTFAENKNKKPEKPTFESIEPNFTSLKLTWKAVADEDDGKPSIYKVYYSKTQLNEGNYKKADYIEVKGTTYDVGYNIVYNLEKLSLNTKYYLALEAIDRWGLTSKVDFSSAKTKENHAPIITRKDNTPIRIERGEKAVLKLVINEPDGQEWNYKIQGHKKGVSYKREGNNVILTFRFSDPVGQHSLTVTVEDIFEAKSQIEIPFEYFKNEPPKLIKNFNKVFTPVGKTHKIDLNTYFKDPEGKKMTFTAKSLSSKFNAAIQDNILSITGDKLGLGEIEVTAKDVEGDETKTKIRLQAVKDGLVYIIYPVPVKTRLNVQLANNVKTAKLIVRTLAGKNVLEKDVKVYGDNKLVTLNLSKLSSGTYALIAKANGKTFNKSFIKY